MVGPRVRSAPLDIPWFVMLMSCRLGHDDDLDPASLYHFDGSGARSVSEIWLHNHDDGLTGISLQCRLLRISGFTVLKTLDPELLPPTIRKYLMFMQLANQRILEVSVS